MVPEPAPTQKRALSTTLGAGGDLIAPAGAVPGFIADAFAASARAESRMLQALAPLPLPSDAQMTLSVPRFAAGASGWYRGPVTVHFTCSDGLSGIAVCPDDVTFTANGTNSITRASTDVAGNTASVTVGDIKIDQEAPTITVNGVTNGGIYTLGAIPLASCTATDSFSGLAGGCSVTVTGGTPNGVGTFNYTATVTDKAGNISTITGSYSVRYRFDGFLQPINDTAHQIGASTSMFKAGSTVPVKFQLKKADGTAVQANNVPSWITPVKGSPTLAPVDESVYSTAPATGGTYRWDTSAQQYIYNWGTGKDQAGYYWRIGVTLDDGQTYFVNIGLR